MQITFEGCIAPLQSAIMVSSDGGCRVKLDIPESEMDVMAALLGMRGQVIRVTFTVEESLSRGRSETYNRATQPTDDLAISGIQRPAD